MEEKGLSAIDFSQKYQGYFWMSDEESPMVFLSTETLSKQLENYGKFPIQLQADLNPNPFVIEGLLYDPENHISYTIKFVDGEYIVHKYVVQPEEKPDKVYLAHRMPGVSQLKFIKRWKKQKDEFCEDMEVYRPAELVFVGFNKLLK